MKPWPNVFMEIAHTIAQRSTCCKKQVGAVITLDNRIIGTGFNGVISGAKHCTDVLMDIIKAGEFFPLWENGDIRIAGKLKIKLNNIHHYIDIPSNLMSRYSIDKYVYEYVYNYCIEQDIIKEWHSEWSTNNELHAEQNALIHSLAMGQASNLKNAVMYVTLSPCINCAKSIAAHKIAKVYFSGEIRSNHSDDGVEYLQKNGIEVLLIP